MRQAMAPHSRGSRLREYAIMLRRFVLFLTVGCVWTSIAVAQDEIVRVERENPTPCATPCDRIAVIFVHGITGAKSTWKNDNGAYWPQLLADDPQIGVKLDIYRIDYDSFILSPGPAAEDVSEVLAAKLDELIFSERRYKKVVFICHSLGGILCRRHLIHVKMRYSHKYASIFGLIVTLGTPMRGSELTKFARLGSQNQQFRVLAEDDINDFLHFLRHVNRDFDLKRNDVCGRITYLAGYETLPVFPMGVIVPRESATLLATRSKEFAKNHIELVKPRGRDDGEVYDWVKNEIMQCDIGSAMCMPIQPSCPGAMPPWLAEGLR